MRRKSILERLRGGDRRSIGESNEVVTFVAKFPKFFPELIAGLWSDDRFVRMRAADAVEKVTRSRHDLIHPYKKELLSLLANAEERELRWHVAVMLIRLPLTDTERQFGASVLLKYLEDNSSIVKTFALQGLGDLAQIDDSLRPTVVGLLRRAARNGTPAMKARSRKLLVQLSDD
jgi:hypothetical protein